MKTIKQIRKRIREDTYSYMYRKGYWKAEQELLKMMDEIKCSAQDNAIWFREKLKSKIKGEFTQEEIRKEAGRFAKDSLKVRKLKGENENDN